MSTPIWLCSSTHSSVASLAAGWYMISLKTMVLSAKTGCLQAEHGQEERRCEPDINAHTVFELDYRWIPSISFLTG